MAAYSVIHTTKTYAVYTYSIGYLRAIKQDNYLVCFAGNTNIYTLSELIQRYKSLTDAHKRVVDIVRRKYGV